jgi:hypothetical protein
MKPFILLVMMGALTLTACKKDNDAELQATKNKVLGKWQVLRYQEEYYHPVSTLAGTDGYDGQPGDSLVFKSDGTVTTYSNGSADEELPYHLPNANTIMIESETYKISKITDTEFNLYGDETDKANDERYVMKISLTR